MSRVAARQPAFEAADRRLRKTMGFQHLLFLSLGGIIGSGWLLAGIKSAAFAGPGAIISWLVGGAFVLLIALSYAEVSGMLPRSGGIVRYPALSHGAYTGFIMAWAYFLSAVAVPPIEAEAVVTYIGGRWPQLHLTSVVGGVPVLSWPNGILMGVVLMAIFFCLNWFGIRFLSEWNRWFTWWKIVIPCFTFIFLFFAFNGRNFGSYGGFMPLGAAPVFQALSVTGIVFAYLGFRQALEYGGEARNPQRDVPMATILSVVIAAAIYTLLQVAFIGALKWGPAGVAPGAWAKLTAGHWGGTPLYSALTASGIGALGAFATLLLIDAAVSPSGTGWIYMGTSARSLYGMSIHRWLPNPLQWVNQFRIPWIPVLASAVAGSLLFIPLPSWFTLVGFITSTTVLTYIMGPLGLPVLRRFAPNLNRPFRLPLASVISPAGFLAALMIVYWSGFTTLIWVFAAVFLGLGLFSWFYAADRGWVQPIAGLVLGVVFVIIFVGINHFGGWVLTTQTTTPVKGSWPWPLYYVAFAAAVVAFSAVLWALSNAEGKHHIQRSAWVIVMLLATLALSYWGDFGPLAKPVIGFPWADLIEVGIGLVCYYWGVFSGIETDELKEITSIGVGAQVPITEEEESAAAAPAPQPA
jgi:amino acid transporter